jgi:hypothetical protein
MYAIVVMALGLLSPSKLASPGRACVSTSRRGASATLLAAATAAVFAPALEPALAGASRGDELAEIARLGAQAKALREMAKTQGVRAALPLASGLETTLLPLQAKMLAVSGEGTDARTQAQLIQGHLLEFKQALAASEFETYVSKRTKKVYPGGKVERELEEVSETYDDFVKAMGM